MRSKIDIGASPAEALAALERIAEECRTAEHDCSANWQDPNAGAPWGVLASEIERAIARARKHYTMKLWID